MDLDVFGKRQVVTNHVNGQGFRVYYQRMANEVSVVQPDTIPPVDEDFLVDPVFPGLFKRGHVRGKESNGRSLPLIPVVPELRLGGPVKYVHLMVAAGVQRYHGNPRPAISGCDTHFARCHRGKADVIRICRPSGYGVHFGQRKPVFLREFPVSLHGRVDCQHPRGIVEGLGCEPDVPAIKDHIGAVVHLWAYRLQDSLFLHNVDVARLSLFPEHVDSVARWLAAKLPNRVYETKCEVSRRRELWAALRHNPVKGISLMGALPVERPTQLRRDLPHTGIQLRRPDQLIEKPSALRRVIVVHLATATRPD